MESIDLKIGQTLSKTFMVKPEHAADHIGSGTARVLSTPMMIAYMEITAVELLAPYLPEGMSSVGTRVDVRHLAPTPPGSTITVIATVLEVEGKRISLAVEAWYGEEQIGAGIHERYLIELRRFEERISRLR